MEILKSQFIAFAYTVKKLGTTEVASADYDPFFDKLNSYSIKVEYKVPEADSKGKLHYHGIIYLKKGFFRKRIMVKGFHVKLVELYNRDGWIKYISKDLEFTSLEQMAEEMETNPPSPNIMLKKKLF